MGYLNHPAVLLAGWILQVFPPKDEKPRTSEGGARAQPVFFGGIFSIYKRNRRLRKMFETNPYYRLCISSHAYCNRICMEEKLFVIEFRTYIYIDYS